MTEPIEEEAAASSSASADGEGSDSPLAPAPQRPGIRSRFRTWRRSRAFWAGVWSILGGVPITAGPASAYKLLLATGTPVWLGVVVGVLIIAFGFFFWFAPNQRQIVGVLVVVLSVASLVTSDFGGFGVGMLLGITGGALGFAWTPVAPRRLDVVPAGRSPVPLE